MKPTPISDGLYYKWNAALNSAPPTLLEDKTFHLFVTLWSRHTARIRRCERDGDPGLRRELNRYKTWINSIRFQLDQRLTIN